MFGGILIATIGSEIIALSWCSSTWDGISFTSGVKELEDKKQVQQLFLFDSSQLFMYITVSLIQFNSF